MEFILSLVIVAFTLAPLVLLIILFVRTNALSSRVQNLENRLGIERRAGQAAAGVPQRPAEQKVSPAPPPPTPKPGRAQEELEALIGGRVMNRIGALALILGVGFFLKYAFDNEWITESMRVLIGIVVGLACLGGGYRTRGRGFAIFAQGLVGAGVAILYLSLYASFNFYHLIPQWLAFVLMSAVTILTLVQAVYYDSLAVGILGWAGGFLTPFMLSTGESNEIALFTYAALLTLGLLALTMKRESWYVLEPLSLGALFTVFFSWYEQYHTQDDFTITLFFLSVFWILFHAADIARARYGPGHASHLRHFIQSVHFLLTYAALYILVWDHDRSALGTATFALGVLYGLSTLVVQVFGLTKSLEVRYGFIVAALILQGTALEFAAVPTVRLWAVEGLALLILGALYEKNFLTLSAFLFFLFSFGGFLFGDASLVFAPIEEFALFSTPRAVTAGVLAFTLGAGALASARFPRSVFSFSRPAFGVAFFLVLFILLTAETNDFFRLQIHTLKAEHGGESIADRLSALADQRQLSISGVWLLYSIVTMTTGIVRKAKGPRFFAIGLFGLTILKIFVFDLTFLETLYRIFSFIGLGLILLGVSYIYQRYKAVLFGAGSSGG